MKRVPAKLADNGRAVTARMAESCANDIDRFPPRKLSAERRMRATSPKLRVDEATGGSLISPEPVEADATKEVPLLSLLLRFVAEWMGQLAGEQLSPWKAGSPVHRTRQSRQCLLRALE